MASHSAVVPVEHITQSIFVLRGTRVILDRDLAASAFRLGHAQIYRQAGW
jgi:hypothetical protein